MNIHLLTYYGRDGGLSLRDITNVRKQMHGGWGEGWVEGEGEGRRGEGWEKGREEENIREWDVQDVGRTGRESERTEVLREPLKG